MIARSISAVVCLKPQLHFSFCILYINMLSNEKMKSKTFIQAQMVKNLPAVWEIWVQPLGGEEPLKKGMATHSSILAWKIPWTEEPGELQSMGSCESWT